MVLYQISEVKVLYDMMRVPEFFFFRLLFVMVEICRETKGKDDIYSHLSVLSFAMMLFCKY